MTPSSSRHESCRNRHPSLPQTASKNTLWTRSSIRANMVEATNSLSVGLVTATSTIFGLRLPNLTNARLSTTGTSLVVTGLTRGSFSRLVFDIIFPPWFLMHPMRCPLMLNFFFQYLSHPHLMLILSLGGCKTGLHN